jgi:hypothetical protein
MSSARLFFFVLSLALAESGQIPPGKSSTPLPFAQEPSSCQDGVVERISGSSAHWMFLAKRDIDLQKLDLAQYYVVVITDDPKLPRVRAMRRTPPNSEALGFEVRIDTVTSQVLGSGWVAWR